MCPPARVGDLDVCPDIRLGLTLQEFEPHGLLPLAQRRWVSSEALVLTGADGQGTFASEDSFLGRAVVGAQIGAGGRYEF